jgi:hypothetical protein
MITRIDTDCILIAEPTWDEAPSQEWLRIVNAVARTIDMLTLYDREFAGRVREWHTLSSDVVSESFIIVEEFNRKIGPAAIPAYTMLAEVFSILEGCGLFKYVSPYYQFTGPTVILPDTVRAAVYRLLDTQDADEISHPEKIVTCTRSRHLPPDLSGLDKAPRSFIYRAPSSVISELEI